MAKSILYRFFRIGKIPVDKKRPLMQEGIALIDEGIHSSIKFKTFKACGRRYYHKVDWFTGSLILTGKRFMAFAKSRAFIHLPLDDERLGRIRVGHSNKDVLSLTFEGADFDNGCSGEVECRFCTIRAEEFAAALSHHNMYSDYLR
ncbi:MAG: hypothetical protein ACOZF0_01630 [Thermodesulfobacteriota bacterium]